MVAAVSSTERKALNTLLTALATARNARLTKYPFGSVAGRLPKNRLANELDDEPAAPQLLMPVPRVSSHTAQQNSPTRNATIKAKAVAMGMSDTPSTP